MIQIKNQLSEYLTRYATFNETDIELIFHQCSYKKYQKKDFLLKQGAVCNYNFFILKGLVRQFRFDDNGHENISAFGIENWWITNLNSFLNQTPSTNSIQAIEETIVLQITKEKLEILYIKIPALERAFRKITENMLIALQRKDEIFMKTNSKERYYTMVKQLPDFFQRVPQYMIASYLDITPEYLSEIRKNI